MFEELITKGPPLFFNGLQLFVVEDTPRMQLSADCPVTPAMREETNAWMRDFFGMQNILPNGLAYHDLKRRCLVCNPRTMESIRRAVQTLDSAKQPKRDPLPKPPSKKTGSPAAQDKRSSKHRKQLPRR